MSNSLYTFYSLGIVVEDKERESVKLVVTPTEVLPNAKGKLGDYKIPPKVSQEKLVKGNHTSNKTGDGKLTAVWLAGENSQRTTPPNMRKGERVMIYTYADTQLYFWRAIEIKEDLRRLEDVSYKFGNLSKIGGTWGKDGAWTFRVNTFDKYASFTTTTSDGESFSYEFKIDAKAGTVSVKDNKNQHFTLNTADGTFTAKANNHIILDAPLTTIKGDCKVDKNVKVDGNHSTGGSAKIGGSLHVNGIRTSGCRGC